MFPGNIKMAIDWSNRPLVEQVVAYGRLPLQIPLILWALRVRRVTGHHFSNSTLPRR